MDTLIRIIRIRLEINSFWFLFFCTCNEPKSVLAHDLGGCHDNLRSLILKFDIEEVAEWPDYGIGLEELYYMQKAAVNVM